MDTSPVEADWYGARQSRGESESNGCAGWLVVAVVMRPIRDPHVSHELPE